MKVLQVAYRSEIAGGEMVLLQLCKAIRHNGGEVVVVCPKEGSLERALHANGVEVELLPMRKTYDVPAVLGLRRLIRKHAVELVHSHGLLVNVLSRMAAFLAGIPMIGTVHLTRAMASHPWAPSLLKALKFRWYYRLIDNWSERLSSQTIAVSQAVRDDLIQQGYPPKKISVISNGIDTAPFASSSKNDRTSLRKDLGVAPTDLLLGVVARLSPQKDLSCFLQSFALAMRSNDTLHAFIAGTGIEEKQLKELSTELGISARCKFLGFRDDVPALLRACDIFVLTSRWEGLPLSVLEAMAAERPVVATAVPGTTEAVVDGKTGFICPIGDIEALSNAILKLSNDPELRQQMGMKGLRRVRESFSHDRVSRQHLALYQSITQGGR